MGPITALAYVLTLENPKRFAKSRDVGPYLGLVPNQERLGRESAVEALADAVGLRELSFGAGVIDVLHRQIELVLVMLALAAVFRAAIGENAQQRNIAVLQ